MELEALVAELNSLHDLDRAVARLIAHGSDAIAPLERFLFEGKPSVVYQPRCGAVEALGALGAKDALLRYLTWKKEIPDAAVRLAEQSVENAAARELAALGGQDVRDALLRMAVPAPQPGLVEALAGLACLDAIPYFVRALEDDFCRFAAEDALRTLGRQVELALVSSSRTALPSIDEERVSSKRRRARSLELLAELGSTAEFWPALRPLLADSDAAIVLAVSKIAATLGESRDRVTAAARLREILPQGDWFLREEIRDCLTQLSRDSAR
ncbi:MAG TPA: hypothetical protein VIY49_26295 [Bryobacteraceae bacterium]